MIKHLRSILISTLGNVFEWYDFGLFTIFSSVLSNLFFPDIFPHSALIATLGIFAVGFICRPLGALIFGYLGDRLGRAQTLRYSILMISLPTFFIGLIPTYQQIGFFAPVLLLITRMWQGISIGGEYSGNIIYLAENASDQHRAFISSFASISANLGLLLAALMGFLCTKFFSAEALMHVGWRIPYLIGGMLSLLIFVYRLKLHESQVYLKLKNTKQIVFNPIYTVFKINFKDILKTLGLVTMGTTFYYFLFAYIPIFLTQHSKMTIGETSSIMSILLIIMIIVAPIAGIVCDSVGRRKMLLFNSIFIICIIIPGYYLLQLKGWWLMISVLFFFAMASALEQGSTPAAIVENFPSNVRYTGISLSYNLGNGLIGGTVPIFCQWMIDKTNIALLPSFYITICALITFSVIYFYIKKTRISFN